MESGNARFASAVDKRMLRELMAKGQAPLVAILACSDSRVDPMRIFDMSLGQAYLVRNAGNCVSDPVVIGSLEYAVSHLRVKGVLVMGHTDCGAVEASYSTQRIQNLDQVMRDLARVKATLGPDKSKDRDAVSEANVRYQMRRLLESSPLVSDKVKDGSLKVIGAIYQSFTGEVRFLE